ncbi:hypothetical protein BBJ29_001728 [Phytophthora kernoviae]|uniref:Adenine DNA glycosylase n=2 Tax=Phytophthora kernoviae TaxID=325452 RepID=A0A3R7N2N1_9STRA|nr:hypothetical protein BBJ29_001728 [Phytophthora kernoviae]
MTHIRTKQEAACAASSQPDIEDLIKSEASEDVADQLPSFSTQHHVSRHDFQPRELLATRTELLVCQKKKTSGKNGALEAFLKPKEEPKLKQQVKVEIDGGVAASPRKVEPYETWVSEIMLQQTRVDTVVEYFLRWIDKFPTVVALAEANEEDVNALWAGLGYYRRARMLHAGAKYVVENFGGELPSTVEQLLKIPGIGPYTAGAISSIAFGNRVPLVDGNVIRVMARMRAVGADPKNKQLINFSWEAAKELVAECECPGALNQALMELGATVCTNPQCSDCSVKTVCLAYEEIQSKNIKQKSESSLSNMESSDSCSICDYSRVAEWDEAQTKVTKYPLKAKKNDSKNEVICVTVVSSPPGEKDANAPSVATAKGKRKASKGIDTDKQASPSDWSFLMSKRPEGGLLAGQWEFLHSKMSDGDKIPPFSKRKTFMDTRLTDTLGKAALAHFGKSTPERRDLGELTHIFSHIKHHMGIEHMHFTSQLSLLPSAQSGELRWMTVAEMQQLGITTGVKKILQLVLHPDKKDKKTNKKSISTTKPQSPPERVIYFRDLNSSDIPKVRELHEEWFPIRYNQAFYDGAAQGLWMETGGPLFARLAVEMNPSTTELQPVRPLTDEDRREEHVLGVVTASTLPLSKVDDPDLISQDNWEHTHVMYILTLGTKSSADNISARYFYEKNGFQNLRYLKDYYMIDGVRHDAFLYIRYVNGASPQSGWFDLITRPLFALFSIASFGWRKIIEGFTVEEFEDTTTEKASRLSASAPMDSANIVPSFEKSKNELDDLLDMLGGDDTKPAAAHPQPTSLRAGAYNSSAAKSSSEFQAGGTKK